MIEKHYGRYIKNDADEQLRRLVGSESVTFSVTPKREAVGNTAEPIENLEEQNGGPTWIRTRDLPVMSRWL
jgi:hypothetical protein